MKNLSRLLALATILLARVAAADDCDLNSLVTDGIAAGGQHDGETTLSIHAGPGDTPNQSVILTTPGAPRVNFRVRAAEYFACRLARDHQELSQQLQTLSNPMPAEGTPEYKHLYDVRFRIARIEKEQAEGTQTAASVALFADLLRTALASCQAPAAGSTAPSCQPKDAAALRAKMQEIAAHDLSFSKDPKVYGLTALSVTSLFGDSGTGAFPGDKTATTLRLGGSPVLARFGVQQLTCAAAGCTAGAKITAPAPPPPPHVEQNVAAPIIHPVPALNGGSSGGRALTQTQVGQISTTLSKQLEALRRCVDVHYPPAGRKLADLSQDELDRAFERDYTNSKASLSEPANHLRQVKTQVAAALTQADAGTADTSGAAPSSLIPEIETQLQALEGGDDFRGFAAASRDFMSLLKRAAALAEQRAGKDSDPAKIARQAVRNATGILNGQFPFGAMISASSCRALSVEVAARTRQIHANTGVRPTGASSSGIVTKSGDCLFTEAALIAHIDEVIDIAQQAGSDEDTRHKLAGLSPSERAVVYQTIQQYTAKHFKAGAASNDADRAELTDMVNYLLGHLQ
jgi:hypothetical protein